MPHLRDDSLEKYLFGRSSKAHLIRTEEHLLLCGSCRQRLDDFDAFLQALKGASKTADGAGDLEHLSAVSQI